MTRAIVLAYDVFSMESPVYMTKNGVEVYRYVPSDVAQASIALTKLAYENGIYNIAIQAPDRFAQEIRDTITEYENKLYSENKIKVEVI